MPPQQQDFIDVAASLLGHEIDSLNEEGVKGVFRRVLTDLTQRYPGFNFNEAMVTDVYDRFTKETHEANERSLTNAQVDAINEMVTQGANELDLRLWMRNNGLEAQTRQIATQQAARIFKALKLYAQDMSKKHSQSLTKGTVSIITKPAMTVETQHIIEQAEAETFRQAEAPTHPAPDTRDELGNIATEAARLDEVLAALHERDIPLTTTEVETAIGGLRSIIQHSNKTAWQLGMHAVEKGLISQAKLAELLGASTATVSRRYHEGLDETEMKKLVRTDARTNPVT